MDIMLRIQFHSYGRLMKNPIAVISRSFTFRTLYYWCKFIGINPLNLSSNNEFQFSYFSFFYSYFLTAIYSCILYYVVIERLKVLVPGETPISVIVNLFMICISYVEIVISYFTYGFYQNRIKLIIKSFVKVERTSRKLNIPVDYKKRFNQLGIYLTLVNAIYIAMLTINMRLLMHFPSFNPLIWSLYNLPRLNVFNSGTLFIWCLLNVKDKFCQLNDKVRLLTQDNYMRTRELQSEIAPGLIRSFRSNPSLLSDRINIITALHRELRDLISTIEGHFALMALFGILVLLANVTLNVYVVFRFVKVHSPISATTFMCSGAISIWVFWPMALLTIISNVCASTSENANDAGNSLHVMLNSCNNFGDARVAAKLNAFSLELLRNQVNISVLGLFELDHFLVCKFLTAAAMYVTIMLQFYS